MPTAKQLPSGSWNVVVYAGKDNTGKRRYESFTAPTKKQAEYLAAQWQVQRTARPEDLTVGQALIKYIENNTSVLSPSTIAKYRSINRNHFAPLRSVSLRRLDTAAVQAYINSISRDHSPKTVACVYGLLSAALSQFAPDLTLRVRLPRRIPHEISIPSPEEVARMIDEAGDALRPVLVIASTMGLRRGEISALTWSDVQGSTLRINKAYTKGPDNLFILHVPKTNAGIRTLEIPPAARPFLTPPPGADPDARITPLSPDNITHRFERLLRRLNLPPYRFHSLRHYYDSVLLSLGVPDKYIMARMGHATTSMTKQVYQHIMRSTDQQITDTINAFFK